MEHIKTILPIALVITSTIFVALGAKTCAKADKSTDNGEKENHFLSGIAAFLLAGFLVLLAIFIKTSTL